MSASSRAILDMIKYQLINWGAKEQFGNGFLKLELLTLTRWILILILLPTRSRASGICHYSNFGFINVLFADRPTSSRQTGRTQTFPIQKLLYIYACAEPKPINLARVSWLRLHVAWICPPCVWIRAGPRPPSSTRCENTFLSVDKRTSEMMSSLFKDRGLF